LIILKGILCKGRRSSVSVVTVLWVVSPSFYSQQTPGILSVLYITINIIPEHR